MESVRCEICGTNVKYEFFNKLYHTTSCECGVVTRVYDLEGKLLYWTVLKGDGDLIELKGE